MVYVYMNYLELLQAASRNMFGDNDPRSIFDFLENPNSFGVGILRAFAISTRYVFNLTRLPTLKRDLVNYATRVINDISSPYSVQNTFDMAYFIQVYGNFMSKSVPRHPQLTQQTSIRRLVPRPQQQQQQQLPPPQYPYTNPELQYMNANGPRPQVQPSIDTYYGPGQAQLLQQQAQQKPQMMFQQLQQGPIQLESLGMTKSFVYPGSDPMLFNEPEFVERQDPIYTVVKRLAASWLGTSTQKAIPNIRYTFHFSFEGEVWRSLTENGFEVHLRIFDIDKGLDVPLTADSNFVVAGSNYPLPTHRKVRTKNLKPFIVNRYLNITKYLFPGGNYVNFVVPSGINQGILVVQLVKQNTVKSLVERVPSLLAPPRPKESSSGSGGSGAGGNDSDDEDICISDTRLPLQCPLSLARIKIPAKGRQCYHQKCFDLEIYIQFCAQNGLWECPICNRTCKYQDLVVDEWFTKALSLARPDDLFISIDENGNFEVDTTQDESSDAGSGDAKPSADQQAKVESRSATESAQQKQQPVDIVCLDSDSESDNDITQPPNNAAQAPAATTTNVPQQQQTPAPMSEVLPAVAAATAVQPTTSRASLTTATRLSDTDVVSTQLGVYENTPLFQQCERPAATTTTYAVTDDSSRYQETNRVSNNTDDYSQNMGMKTPVRIAPIGIPSNQRRNLILSNKRRYQKGRNSSNNRPVKVTKVQMEGNEVELIDLSSSDDDNNDEESTAAPLSFSSSSSSSSSSSGTDSPESFHIKKCMNGRMRRFELSNSESSDDDNKYEDDEEVIKSSCSQKDTQPPQQRTPQQNEPIQPPFTQQPKQQLSSVQQPMQQQQRQQQQQQQQSVKSVPPKITGFEQVLVKGNLVQKPIVLSHTNSHQSLSRTPSMQQVPLPPTNNQQPPEPQNTSFTSFSSFTTMQQPPQFVQQQQQQSATFESENVPTASQIRLEPLSQMSAPGIYQQQQANNSAIFGEPLTLAPFVEQPSSVQIPQFQNLYQTTQQPQGPTLMPLGPQHQNNVQQQLPSLPQQQRWQ